MTDIETLLNRWKSAGVLEAEAADRIRIWEAGEGRPALPDTAGVRKVVAAGVAWQGLLALVLGGILLATGVVLFVSAHWDDISPGARFALVLAMVAVFHLAGVLSRDNYRALSTTMHAVGTISTGAAIALVGQIFNIQEHWPAAILLWAIAAIAGWAFLHDQAQQTLALLLVPAWLFSELVFYTHLRIGQMPYLGRFLVVWGVFYLTVFLGSQRKVVQGISFAVSAVSAIAGTVLMCAGWSSWAASQTFIPFGTRFWAWTVIAAIPLAVCAFKGHWGLIPPAAAVIYAVALPWCQRIWIESYNYAYGATGTYTRNQPNLIAHALVAAFAIFITAWGVHRVSRSLVNLGVVYFALAVAWFYFSDIFDKVGRSLGLIGLGILFLAGGWVLEQTRRRLLAGFNKTTPARLEAQ